MQDTVYLKVKDLNGVIENGIIALANHRNATVEGYTPLEVGATYNDLKTKYEALSPVKGAGYCKHLGGVEYWILPFESHPQMIQPAPEIAEVLTKNQIKMLSWDEIEELV